MTKSKLFILITASGFLSGCFHTNEEAWQGWRQPEAVPSAAPTQTIEQIDQEIKTDVEVELDSDLREIDNELNEIEQELQ